VANCTTARGASSQDRPPSAEHWQPRIKVSLIRPCLLQWPRQFRRAEVSANASAPQPLVVIAKRRTTMKNPLDSLWGTVISGVILTAILYFVVKTILASAGAW